tara:strand:- start:72 stop:722 length:651 start_codon:yes stop_codon:yes gene_type:complete
MPLINTISLNDAIRHVGCSNSSFTGNTEVQVGNIAQATAAAKPLTTVYNTGGTFTGGVDGATIPGTFVGTYVVTEGDSTQPSTILGAGYECRRGSNLITSDGRLQLAVSEINGYQLTVPFDARWCVYGGSEDFNVMVFSHEYTSTDPANVGQGNNQEELLKLTKRLPNFLGQGGPIGLNGTINDLSGLNGIFTKGMLVTWESAGTTQQATMCAWGV